MILGAKNQRGGGKLFKKNVNTLRKTWSNRKIIYRTVRVLQYVKIFQKIRDVFRIIEPSEKLKLWFTEQ